MGIKHGAITTVHDIDILCQLIHYGDHCGLALTRRTGGGGLVLTRRARGRVWPTLHTECHSVYPCAPPVYLPAMGIAVHTQGGAHTRRFVATAGVLLFKRGAGAGPRVERSEL